MALAAMYSFTQVLEANIYYYGNFDVFYELVIGL